MYAVDSEWHARPDLIYCTYCGYNARIETRWTAIGTQWLCHTCGVNGRINDKPGAPCARVRLLLEDGTVLLEALTPGSL